MYALGTRRRKLDGCDLSPVTVACVYNISASGDSCSAYEAAMESYR